MIGPPYLRFIPKIPQLVYLGVSSTFICNIFGQTQLQEERTSLNSGNRPNLVEMLTLQYTLEWEVGEVHFCMIFLSTKYRELRLYSYCIEKYSCEPATELLKSWKTVFDHCQSSRKVFPVVVFYWTALKSLSWRLRVLSAALWNFTSSLLMFEISRSLNLRRRCCRCVCSRFTFFVSSLTSSKGIARESSSDEASLFPPSRSMSSIPAAASTSILEISVSILETFSAGIASRA